MIMKGQITEEQITELYSLLGLSTDEERRNFTKFCDHGSKSAPFFVVQNNTCSPLSSKENAKYAELEQDPK